MLDKMLENALAVGFQGLAESLDAVTRRKGEVGGAIGQVIDAVGTLAGNAATFVSSAVQLEGPLKLLSSIPAAVKDQIAAIGNTPETLGKIRLGQAGNIKAGGLLNLASGAAQAIRTTANNLKNEGTWGSQNCPCCQIVCLTI